jgi:glutamate dehydrogenase (NAD(P)+)
MVIERACRRLGWDLAEQRCVVQGFGNVGGIAAQELVSKGAIVLAVSDVSGGVYSPSGLDLEAVRTWVAVHGSLVGYPDGRHVSNSELLELPCDILVLAALEEQLTAENARASTRSSWRGRRQRPDDDRGRCDPRGSRHPHPP